MQAQRQRKTFSVLLKIIHPQGFLYAEIRGWYCELRGLGVAEGVMEVLGVAGNLGKNFVGGLGT